MADAVDRLVTCLQAVADEPGGITAIRMAERVGLTRVSSSRILKSLERSGLVERNPETRKYVIGLNLWLLGAAALGWRRLADMALLPMARAVATIGTTLTIGVNRNRRTIFLNKVESIEGMVLVTPGPATYPAHVTAVGKAILAYEPSDVIDRYIAAGLASVTPVSINTEQTLLEELRRTRERGYSVTLGEHREDRRGIAVPVRDHQGNVVAALGAASQIESFDDDFIKQHVPILREAAASVSRLIGVGQASSAHVA